MENWLESAGVLATVLGIWLTTKRKLICWPVTVLADLIYLIFFYRVKLFSDSLLQLFFILFSVYGWWHWKSGLKEEGAIRVVKLPLMKLMAEVAVALVGGWLLGIWMVRLGAALPYLDAQLTSFSLLATWWQARKHTVNWWLWIVVNVVYIGEYVFKGVNLTAVLYAGLVVLAVMGLRDWRGAESLNQSN
jgi:nicotinamide mononucleotide transporter